MLPGHGPGAVEAHDVQLLAAIEVGDGLGEQVHRVKDQGSLSLKKGKQLGPFKDICSELGILMCSSCMIYRLYSIIVPHVH